MISVPNSLPLLWPLFPCAQPCMGPYTGGDHALLIVQCLWEEGVFTEVLWRMGLLSLGPIFGGALKIRAVRLPVRGIVFGCFLDMGFNPLGFNQGVIALQPVWGVFGGVGRAPLNNSAPAGSRGRAGGGGQTNSPHTLSLSQPNFPLRLWCNFCAWHAMTKALDPLVWKNPTPPSLFPRRNHVYVVIRVIFFFAVNARNKKTVTSCNFFFAGLHDLPQKKITRRDGFFVTRIYSEKKITRLTAKKNYMT